MRFVSRVLLAGALLALAGSAVAQENRLSFGGDEYAAGQAVTLATPAARDAFLAGYDVSLQAPVAGDAHLAGFNVTSNAAVTGDLYAAGFSVNLLGTVGGDVTAAGNSVSVRPPQPVAGNVRLAGATVTLGGPVAGSALITASTLALDGPVTGDLSFFGENLTFGPGARVDGTLTIQAPKEIAVPATVASADRVKFIERAAPDYASEAGKTAEQVMRSIWPTVWATGIWWLLLFVVGVAFIGLLPRLVAALQVAADRRPFRNLGLGILAFASVVGLVPVFALTIVGIFLLPFVLVFVAIACMLAYLAGTYLIGARIAGAIVPLDTRLKRVVALAASIVVAGLLAMIPVLGWLLSLVLLVFGFGAIAVLTMVRWSSRDAARLAAAEGPAAQPS